MTVLNCDSTLLRSERCNKHRGPNWQPNFSGYWCLPQLWLSLWRGNCYLIHNHHFEDVEIVTVGRLQTSLIWLCA